MLKLFVQRFVGIALFVVALTAAGTVGYVVIEGWPIHDALYMTVITITAVGYSEIHPLSDAGRDLSIVLIVGGITALGIWFALITSFIVELDLKDVLGEADQINSLREHLAG